MRVLDHLLKAVRDAAVFNPEVQVAPACILWPDRDHHRPVFCGRIVTISGKPSYLFFRPNCLNS